MAPAPPAFRSDRRAARSTEPTPHRNGSPEASTQTLRPRCSITSAVARSNGLGQGPHRAADQRRGELQMALAAEHDLGGGDQTARHRAQALDAVLADPDDGQPAARCGTLNGERTSGWHEEHSHTRRYGGSAAARGIAGWPQRHQDDAVARRPHRCACGAAGSGADRRLRRRGGPGRLSQGRARRRADRRHASLCGGDLEACRRGRGFGRRADGGVAPTGLDRCRRRSLDRSRRYGRALSPRSARSPGACSWPSAARRSTPSPRRRSTTISSAASIRSSRR